MGYQLPSARVGSSQTGLFGPHTATIDFCELNYEVTPYVAEFWNSISNLGYIILGGIGVRYARKEHLPRRAQLCFAALIVIGIGSTLFHSGPSFALPSCNLINTNLTVTLLQVTQMMDDIPMMIEVSVSLYAACENKPKAKLNLPLAGLLIFLNTLTIYSDYQHWSPVVHYIAFASLAFASTFRIIQLLLKTGSGLSSQKRKQITSCYSRGFLIFMVGFAIWNLDNIYCDTLIAQRKKLGFPSSVLLEGHVYWHLLTALGTYLCITSGILLCLSVPSPQKSFVFKNGFMYLPYVAEEHVVHKTD